MCETRVWFKALKEVVFLTCSCETYLMLEVIFKKSKLKMAFLSVPLFQIVVN